MGKSEKQKVSQKFHHPPSARVNKRKRCQRKNQPKSDAASKPVKMECPLSIVVAWFQSCGYKYPQESTYYLHGSSQFLPLVSATLWDVCPKTTMMILTWLDFLKAKEQV